jgi:hypothetical protein
MVSARRRLGLLLVLLAATMAAASFFAATARPASAQPARAAVATRSLNPVAAAIAKGLVTELAKGAAGEAGGQALGFALSAMGIGPDAATAAALAQIQQTLARIGDQVTALQAQTAAIYELVARSDYNNAARAAVPILRSIDHAEGLLRAASRQTAASNAQKKISKEAFDYIGAHLLDKFDTLAGYVSGSGPAAPDSIISSAFQAKTADNFLTHEDSVAIRYLVDYYALYEAQLAHLIAEYRNAETDYPRSEVKLFVDHAVRSVDALLNARRDQVSIGTVFDARTGLQWSTKLYGVTAHPGALNGFFGFSPLLRLQLPHETGLNGWKAPDLDQMRGLIAGWSGPRIDAWLRDRGGFAYPMEGGVVGGRNTEFWTTTLTADIPSILGGPRFTAYAVMHMVNGDTPSRISGHDEHGFIPVRVPPHG